MEEWRDRFVEANGVRLHVVEAGEGPLVVLLHGFPQFWYAWRHQIRALSKRFRVVAPDMRGYGDSERPPRVADYHIDLLTDDVKELIHVLGAEKAHLVGHDWGGGVAWMTAIRHPGVIERLCVLNCPHPVPFAKALRSSFRQLGRSWYMFAFQIPWLPEWFLTRRDGAMVGPMFREMAVRKDAFSDEDLEQFRRNLLKPGCASAMVNYYRAAFRNRRAMEAADGRKISAPTLLVWAENDIALGKELTYGMEPLFEGPFRIEYIPNCSHWVNEEQPERVNELLLEHLG